MALDTGKSFENDVNIDGSKIQKVMEARISFYDKLETEQREANRRASSDLFSTLGVKLLLNETVLESDVAKLNAMDLLRYQKLKDDILREDQRLTEKVLQYPTTTEFLEENIYQ